MKNKSIIASSCLLLVAVQQSIVQAESLWQRRNPQNAFLFYDSKARHIGDSVTVIISQTTDVANTEKRDLGKSTSTKGMFGFAGASDGGLGEQGGSASLELESASDRKFDGSSGYRSAQAFTDRMTCTVMDVLPNGNMVISGERRVRVAGEERTLVLSGIIRGLDLGPDNNISSQYISQFRMEYQASGASQKFTRQGWLGRGVNAVWPW